MNTENVYTILSTKILYQTSHTHLVTVQVIFWPPMYLSSLNRVPHPVKPYLNHYKGISPL